MKGNIIMKKLLLIVDMQNDFVTGPLGTNEAQAIVSDMTTFAEQFDGDIAFTKDTHSNDYLSTQEGQKLPIAHTVKNTEGWQIINELRHIEHRPDVRIFEKPVFGSADLYEFLKAQCKHKDRYTDLYLVGVCTGICVLSNAVLARTADPELNIHVIDDLCACIDYHTNHTALNALQTLQVTRWKLKTETLMLSKAKYNEMQQDLQETEDFKRLCQKYNRYDTRTWTVPFGHSTEIDLKFCIGDTHDETSNPCWFETVLFHEGCEYTCSEAMDEIPDVITMTNPKIHTIYQVRINLI